MVCHLLSYQVPITMKAHINEFRALLRINKHALDDALEQQPEVMDRISQQVTRAESAMLFLKDELAKVEGKLFSEAKAEDRKLTKDEIDSEIRHNPKRLRAFEDYQTAKAEHDEWSGLLEAWRTRGFSINKLGDLYAANYYTKSSHSARPLSDAEMMNRRREMREAGPRENYADRAARRAEDSIREAGASRRTEDSEEPKPRRRRVD